ncbi:MAG TPA: TonB-dependent receptor [Longimicrobiaceae bacterium]
MKSNPQRHLPLLALVALATLALPAAQAQAQSVSGTVTAEQSLAPLQGANIRVKGSTVGTATNAQGAFTLQVPSLQDTLVVSMLGYAPREIPIEGRTRIDVALTIEAVQVEELVVTGYRVQERASVTGSVSSVNAEEFADVPADNLSNALAGRLSGVTITQNAGTPGRESNIRIRAVGTFNNDDPLYVIDGMVSDKFAFDGLSTQEIEAVSILKDGAAASIYGSRAANGVVLVTTRRGRISAPQFSYNGTVGLQTPTRIPASLNAFQHAKAINDALSYNGVPLSDARYYTQDELDYFRSNSWNWVDELWEDPANTQHALNITGGTDLVRYFLSGSYNYGEGSFDNLSFQRYTARANVDVYLTNNLTATLDFSNERRDRRGPSWGGNDWGHEDLYKALALRTSMVPPYINGLPVGNWVEWHPGVVIDNGAGYDRRDWTSFNTRARLDYKMPFLEGLSANLAFNKLNRESHRKQFNLPYEMTYFNTLGENSHIVGTEPVGIRPRNAAEFLMHRQDRDDDYQLNAQLSFDRSFGAHNVDAFLVYEQAETDHVWFDARRDNFISPAIDQFIGGSNAPEDSRVNGSQSQGARISYVGSLGYNYDDRYLIDGSFRYDGSVIFAPEHRWGFFPAVSAGWRISEEPFFNFDFVDQLMLRGSFGIVGNDDVGSFQWLQSYEIEEGAIFDSPAPGLSTGSLANRAITWEKSKSYNVGLDSRFWDNRLSFTADVFYRNTYDILGSRQAAVPSTFGASLPDENYQEIDARGFELELGYNSRFGNPSNPINYYVRGNFGYATNEVIRLDEPENIRAYESEIGRPIGGEFGYISTGILRTQADIDALPEGYTILGAAPQLGMLNYVDLRGPNSDEPDGRITGDDQAWIADYTSPPMSYGFTLGGSWGALGVDALFHGAAGHKHMMHTNGRDLQARAEESSYGYWADSWTPENPDGAYPGYRATHYRTRYPESTFWLRDASFLRLKTLTVSFDVPQGFASRVGASEARLFFTGTNLALLHQNFGDWGFDPEANNIRAYPLMRTLSLGLNVSH